MHFFWQKNDLANQYNNKTLLDSIVAGVYIYDIPADKLTYTNAAYTRLTGWTLEEVNAASPNFEKFYHKNDAQIVADHTKELIDTPMGESLEVTYRWRHKNGDMRNYLWANTPLEKDSAGKTTKIIGSFIDITGVIKTNEVNELLIKAFGEIVYTHDVEKGKIFWRGNYKKTLGYSKTEMGNTEESWLSRVHPDDLNSVNSEFERAKKNDLVFELEYRFEKSDGTYIWVQDVGAMIKDGDELTTVVGVMRDINDRKELQQHREDRLHELEEINQMVIERENRMVLLKQEVDELSSRYEGKNRYN